MLGSVSSDPDPNLSHSDPNSKCSYYTNTKVPMLIIITR